MHEQPTLPHAGLDKAAPAPRRIFHENRFLLLSLLLLLLLSNVPYGAYVLYPFELFSTWIHEFCHGLASLAVGGRLDSLQIFSDGSGLANNAYHDSIFRGIFVSSAGYLGTTFFGALLLILQRPTPFSRSCALLFVFALVGILLFGVASVTGYFYFGSLLVGVSWLAFWTEEEHIGRVGNLCLGGMLWMTLLVAKGLFTYVALLGLGGALVAVATFAPRELSRGLFSFLAATCGLNALTGIRALFSSVQLINGKPSASSDAHSVAKLLFGPPALWATLWLLLSLVILSLALIRAIATPSEEPPDPSSPRSLNA